MIEIYDWETLKGLATVTFVNPETLEKTAFVLHPKMDQSKELYEFLKSVDTLVGFNNLAFDGPLTDEFIRLYERGEDKIYKGLYRKAQQLVTSDSKFHPTCSIRQIDLYELNHFSNAAKSASLKWLQINMGFHTVMDMPIHHSEKPTAEQIPMVLEYNLNDVMATLELYNRSKGLLDIRKAQGDRYGIDMTNYSNSKMGEAIILKRLADKMQMKFENLKSMRGSVETVHLKDVILPSVSFKSKEFQSVLTKFRQTTVNANSEFPSTKVVFDGIEYSFGLGGLHASAKPGIYHNVKTSDVSSYYPSFAVSQKLKIKRFGDNFHQVYEGVVLERRSHPKGTADNAALKEALNSVFGKSKSEFSPLVDSHFFYSITINGQLLLAMLCERIVTMGIGKIIIANTDGIEVDVHDHKKYLDLCSKWEEKFGLILEHGEYSKLALNSCNHYIAIGKKVKEKGMYVTDPELHKDRSSLIIQKAVKEFIVNDIPVEQTIRSEHDIKLFLIGRRAKTGKFIAKSSKGEEPLQKHIRYYISKRGVKLYKRLKDGDVEEHKGYFVTMANVLPQELVDLDYSYYIRESNKLIEVFYEKQLSLF